VAKGRAEKKRRMS